MKILNIVTVTLVLTTVTMAIYIEKKDKKNKISNESSSGSGSDKHRSAVSTVKKKWWYYGFHSDKAIAKYLHVVHLPMMIWQCRTIIQPYWGGKPIPLVELYCETIGTLERVSWYHNWKPIKLGGRYRQEIMPHYYSGRYYSRWIDFTLHIYNATPKDAGIYIFKAESPNGYTQQQYIYVDISMRKKRQQIPHKNKP